MYIGWLCGWKLRNPQENFRYATVKDSAVAMYFKRQVELSTMYRTMEGQNYDTPEDAILDVKNGLVILFADVTLGHVFGTAWQYTCAMKTLPIPL